MAYAVDVNSTSSADPYATSGQFGSNFTNAPSYNKPGIDFANPLHLAAIAAVLFVAWKWKRRG